MVHSSLFRTCRGRGMTPADVLESFLEAIGPRGTLVLPTFTYDGWCHGEPFDCSTTPSRMGALTETSRNYPGAERTGNPMYSFVAIGEAAPEFRHMDNYSGYGEDSPFARLLEMDAYIASLDVPEGSTNTLYHHVEQMHRVYYRYPKVFGGQWTGWDGITQHKEYELWVRDLELGWKTRVEPMGEELWRLGLYKGEPPGMGEGLRIVRARDFYWIVSRAILEHQEEEYLGVIEADIERISGQRL